jgi:hypothetical protein
MRFRSLAPDDVDRVQRFVNLSGFVPICHILLTEYCQYTVARLAVFSMVARGAGTELMMIDRNMLV